MSISKPSINDQGFPTFRFGTYSWWAGFYHGICFLPQAFQAIQERNFTPTYSFHLVNAQTCLIGISDGDVRYPATKEELDRLKPLIVYLEDRRFFKHFGIDVIGIARAMTANLRFCGIVQGGSTITQQLVRNTLLAPERSIMRKILEMLLAIKMEKHFSKQEILDLYCNYVYLGKGIRGFSAAAKIILRSKLSAINDLQIYGLLGLLRTPERTFPDKDSVQFIKRQNQISKILKTKIFKTDLQGVKPNPINVGNFKCPRLTQIVRSELVSLTGYIPRDMRRVGLTINNIVQTSLSEALCEITRLPQVKSAAGIILSTTRADVLAEVAWKSGYATQFSPAYFGSLQPGSTFKTFALLSALQQGISLTQTLTSAPFESSCFRSGRNNPWRVRNYANMYKGEICLKDAFKLSDNTAFARLVEMLDTEKLFNSYKDFGLFAGEQASPAIVLGGHKGGVSLLSLVAAYRAIANGGTYIRPRIIQYVEFNDGSFLPFPTSRGIQLVREFQAIRDLQLALVEAGPIVRGAKQAGKTGTTRTGSLLATYDDQIATAIWVEYEKPIPEGDPKAVSATQGFDRFMNKLLGYQQDLLLI